MLLRGEKEKTKRKIHTHRGRGRERERERERERVMKKEMLKDSQTGRQTESVGAMRQRESNYNRWKDRQKDSDINIETDREKNHSEIDRHKK